MERWSFALVCFVYLNMIVILVSGLTISNCVEEWIDVPEDTSTFITCSNVSKTETFTWKVENNFRNKTIYKSVCGSITACDDNDNDTTSNDFSLHIINDEASLAINRNHRRYGGFIVTCSTTTKHAECRMHVFHPAELSQCKTEINPRLWRFTATCLVNKLFSPIHNVSCGVTARQNILNSSMTIPQKFFCQLHLQDYTDKVDNNTYQRGICNFSKILSSSPGNYSYIINIKPGRSQETVGEVWIDKFKPSRAKFLQENPSGSCECFTRDPPHYDTRETANYVCNIVRGSTSQTRQPSNLSSLSTTSQTPHWNNGYYSRHSSQTVTTSTTTVTTSSSTTSTTTGTTSSSTTSTTTGTTLSSTTSTTNTPQYSPVSSPSIFTNATQPFVTDGTVKMALFCQGDDVYPVVRYTWAGVRCINKDHERGTCIFTPRVPQDDGYQVMCNAYNVVSFQQRTSEPYTIELNYPPPLPPSIRGYEERSMLTDGENITLYCEVKGGKPQVATVTFVCGDKLDQQDNVYNISVSSPVDIKIKAKHNNTMCLCSATWNPKPKFYSYNTSIRLFVRERTTPRPTSVTTRKMLTSPRQTTVKTSQATYVTTSSGLGLSPSPQSKAGQSVTTGVIAGIVAAVVVTVIIIAAIVYVTRRRQNPSTTRNTSLINKTQDDDFQEQINEFYISADALALNRLHPVDDFPQSRVQDPVAQSSPHKSSDFTDKDY